MKFLRLLAFIILYPLSYLVVTCWPLFLGVYLGAEIIGVLEVLVLWYVLAIIILFRLDRTLWWRQLQGKLDLLTK